MVDNQSKKILVVEDRPNWHKVLKALLLSPKYELQIAQNLKEAKDLIRGYSFDLALININLIDTPEMPKDQLGFELLEFIQAKYPLLPRIVITGEPIGPIFSTFAPLGVDDVLIKSKFNRHHLIEAIENAINKRRRGRRNPITKPYNLSHPHREKLSKKLADIPSWKDVQHQGRIQFLIATGLSETYIRQFNLNSTPDVTAKIVVSNLESIGFLYEVPGYTALGLLVKYLYDICPDIEGKTFFAQIAREYQLTTDQTWLDSLT